MASYCIRVLVSSQVLEKHRLLYESFWAKMHVLCTLKENGGDDA